MASRSTFAAHSVNEELIGRVAKHIQKRENILGNMNKYCWTKAENTMS